MKKKEEGISKNTIVRNYTRGFILGLVGIIGLMIVIGQRIYWNYLLIGGGFILFACLVMGFTTYFYHKSHPKLSKAMAQPEVQNSFSGLNIYLGVIILVAGIYLFITNNSLEQIRMSIFLIVIGILIILWGISDLKKFKKRK